MPVSHTKQPEISIDLALLGNRALQVAVRRNLVCFPSQAPIFGKQPHRDVQWRLAVLYFIRGWSTREIARRYGLTRERCGQIITDWRIRAVNMGYIQDVTPDDFDTLALISTKGDSGAGENAECGPEAFIEVHFALAK
ncbi:MAG: hypothetical protein ABUS49_05355 [Acidobacteriota bacterium]